MVTQYIEKRTWNCLTTEATPTDVRNGDRLIQMDVSNNRINKYVYDAEGDNWISEGSYSASKLEEQAMGKNGGELITDTSEHTGTFVWMVVLEDAVISSITTDSLETGNAYTGFTLVAGTSIPLICTAITLTSGKVKMIKG